MSYAVGIDLGCTNMRGGIVDENRRVVHQARRPSAVERGGESVLADLADFAADLASQCGVARSEIVGAGVGCPGRVDVKTGVVLYATPNLPDWTGAPVGETLAKRLGMPTAVDNDVNVIALGEHRCGAAMDVEDFVCLAVGSGVGGSLFLGGQPYRGSHGLASEMGHLSVYPNGRFCNCGRTGCLEAYASAWAIEERARDRLRAGGESLMEELCEGEPDRATASMVFEAAKEGDLLAMAILGEVTRALANAIADLSNLLDVPRFVITGSVAHQNPGLVERVREELHVAATPLRYPEPQIVASVLGDDAGVLGGAALAFDQAARAAV